MSETTTTETTTESAEVSQEQTTPETKPESNELPDWARKQISKANEDAAKYRVQLREAQAALGTANEKLATLSSEKANAESSYASTQGDFDKLVAAVKTLLPDSNTQVFTFAKTLQGSTGEELAAHAAELSSMFGISTGPQAATDRSQGHGAGPAAASNADKFAAFVKSHVR